jgi:hypothetical protein
LIEPKRADLPGPGPIGLGKGNATGGRFFSGRFIFIRLVTFFELFQGSVFKARSFRGGSFRF